jgi:hypothetical protein
LAPAFDVPPLIEEVVPRVIRVVDRVEELVVLNEPEESACAVIDRHVYAWMHETLNGKVDE